MTSDQDLHHEDAPDHNADLPVPPNVRRDALRVDLIERRKALSASEVAEASRRIVALLADDARVRAATLVGPVGTYWPVPGEPDVRLGGAEGPAAPLGAPHGLTLPGHPTAPPEMRRWVPGAPLATAWGRLGYPANGADTVAPSDHGLILVPALAFDRFGNRLGHGAGWYDRLLAGLRGQPRRNQPRRDQPLLVGIAHEFQLVDRLETQRWDVPMHLVITPAGAITPVA